VLAGAAIEALLHWKLSAADPTLFAKAKAAAVGPGGLRKTPPSDLNDWGLHQYIVVARELGAIPKETAAAALLAKDYRSLIHPGATFRKGQRCDRGTAHLAVGAMEEVARALT
jgi:hypothetical protein